MTFKNKLLPALAIAGILVAVAVAVQSEKKTPPAQPLAQPAQAPFQSYIGGAGIVEASTENISVGASLAGIVKTVFVKVGDRVQAGAPLFLIDDRELRASLSVKEAGLIVAKASLKEAQASLSDYRTRYDLVRHLRDPRAVSVDEVEQRKNAELLAKAKVDSAEASVISAKAELQAARTALERLLVCAPLDGQVLQVSVRPGEYAPTGVLDTPLMRLGDMDRLHVRVDIDENDAWRFTSGARAMAFMRGNSQIKAMLEFVRVELYVTPKVSLTGSSTERVDTRVLQVIYRFERSALPAYVGQQLDVFVETPQATAQASQADQAGSGAGGTVQ